MIYWYNKISLAYLTLILLAVIIPVEYKWPEPAAEAHIVDLIYVAVFCLLWTIHMGLVRLKKNLTPYGKIFMNYYVIDWATFGEDFDLPEHLCQPFPHWVAVRPSDVQHKLEEIEQGLTNAENVRFTVPQRHEELQINVIPVYFRQGERCNESAEQYRSMVISLLEEERMKFFTFLENSKAEDLDPNWVYDNYLHLGYNGSQM